MESFLDPILGPDYYASFLIILNLIIIESLLSVDNAAVLATMVLNLPENQRHKALRIGIIFAYVFRGICLVFATLLIQIWWLKPIGGLYLVYLALEYFKSRQTESKDDDDLLSESDNFVYRTLKRAFGTFWATVASVEIMDLVFSIDNVLAAAVYVERLPQPKQTYLLWFGVFIGIFAMRLVASVFVKLLAKYPFLETAAFTVLLILGIKLTLSTVVHFAPDSSFGQLLNSHTADNILSLLTLSIFIVPIITCQLFNIPKKKF